MTLVVHASDPTARIASAFARIERERMQGVPLLNPALQVQVADVERWEGQWLAALVTPWFLNLLLLPGDAARWRPGREGERVFHRFAAAELAFLGSAEPGLGEFQSCSLVSPMGQFPTQAAALATARAALAALHGPALQQAVDRAGGPQASPAKTPERAADPRPARRVFLFGRA